MRIKRPDRKSAESILQAAEKDMDFTLTIKPTELSAPTIVRNIHECFRMLGDSLLIAKGIEPEDHVMSLKELQTINISADRPMQTLDNLRRLRININYYGYRPTLAELDDALDISNALFMPLAKEVKKKITSL